MQKRRFSIWQAHAVRMLMFFLEWLRESKKEQHDFKSSGIFKENNQLGNRATSWWWKVVKVFEELQSLSSYKEVVQFNHQQMFPVKSHSRLGSQPPETVPGLSYVLITWKFSMISQFHANISTLVPFGNLELKQLLLKKR